MSTYVSSGNTVVVSIPKARCRWQPKMATDRACMCIPDVQGEPGAQGGGSGGTTWCEAERFCLATRCLPGRVGGLRSRSGSGVSPRGFMYESPGPSLSESWRCYKVTKVTRKLHVWGVPSSYEPRNFPPVFVERSYRRHVKSYVFRNLNVFGCLSELRGS